MNVEQAVAFAREHHRAVLHTHRSDGSPQLSPVMVTAGDDGTLRVSTRETAMKARNVARDPRVAVCIFTEAFFGDWVVAWGRADTVHLPDAMEPLVDYYRSISGEHPDWDDYRAAMERERRVLLRITVERAGPDVAG